MSTDLLATLVTPSAPAASAGRSWTKDLHALAARPEGATLVPAAFLGLAVLDAIPTPTDIGFFWGENWLRTRGKTLSPTGYWAAQAANYYGWDILWYTTLFAATSLGGETFTDRAKVGAGVIGTGALAALLWRYTHAEAPRRHPRPSRRIA